MNTERWKQIKEVFLAVLEKPAGERADFLREVCGGDFDLRAEVEKLAGAHFEAESFIENPAFEVASIFQTGGAPQTEKHFGHYKIIREIGAGGMGAVFFATRDDGEFQQEVAVKIIRQSLADAELVNRFRRERQILAGLNHPNIAKLLDGGVSDGGEPFLAMEYVEGAPITEFAETRNLSVKERLELFLKVCSGVAYAHRNLIVHRDLKPSNIFVTKDGGAKLLDFGLAKLLDESLPDEAQTQTAFRALTPAYASPEQLKGEPISTASDIYSLGVVLYELLTGARPFHFKNQSLDEAIHVVCDSNPPKPSEAMENQLRITNYELRDAENSRVQNRQPTTDNRQPTTDNQTANPKSKIQNPKSLKGDLDNIVLTALRKEPERRYGSVEKFAEDIERHLQGLPIKARPNTFSYRAEKFVKRHKYGVAAACLILLTLIGGVAATVWEARRAEQQRARAENRFNDVRKLSHSLMFEIHDSVKDLPGATPTRQLIVSRALEYLDSLARESGDDPSLQRELATAYEKIGDIQGNPYLSNLGDTAGALESYRRSLGIRESLTAADPHSVDIKRELTSSYDHIGDVLGRTGDRRGAVEIIQKSIEIRSQLVAANPADNDLRRELATSRMKIGEHLQSGGDIDAGLENERQALATFESLAAQDSQDFKVLRSVMVTDGKIGYMLYVKGDLPAALETYRKGLAIAETLAAKDANNAPGQRDLSLALNNVGRILLKQKDAAGARENFGKSLAISQKLAAADPKNNLARSDAAYALVRLGAAQAAEGKYREAVESQHQALDINKALLAENPKNMLARSEIGDGDNYIGEALEKTRDTNGALESYRQAASVREEMTNADPNDAQFRQTVAESYQTIGRICAMLAVESHASKAARISQLNEARTWYRRSLDIWQELNSSGKLNDADTKNINMIQTELDKCDETLAKL